jgi:hypothetical protein
MRIRVRTSSIRARVGNNCIVTEMCESVGCSAGQVVCGQITSASFRFQKREYNIPATIMMPITMFKISVNVNPKMISMFHSSIEKPPRI